MPSVLPRSSMPVNCRALPLAPAHRRVGRRGPAGRARTAARASARRRRSCCPVGALTTTIPARVAASRSTLSTPTPARPMTTSRVPAAISSASTLTWLRTTSASYSGRIAASSSRGEVEPLVDLVVAAQELEALGRQRLDDEDPISDPGRRPGGREQRLLGRGDGGAGPDVDRRSSIARRLERPDRGEDRRRSSPSPRWPSRKIRPFSLPWPPASTRPAALEPAVERLPVEASGIQAAVTVCDATSSSASSSKPSARRPARAIAAQASWRANTPSPSACISRSPSSTWYSTATAGVHGVSPPTAASRWRSQVEVEARHPRRLARGPAARPDRDHRHARGAPSRPSASP